jgi:putative DNA primase/helicase
MLVTDLSQSLDITPVLSPAHRKELLEKRSLDESWISANCISVSADEATQRLGYIAKSAGILLEGTGIQVQFKPDNPWKKEGEKKASKYRLTLCKSQNQGGQV